MNLRAVPDFNILLSLYIDSLDLHDGRRAVQVARTLAGSSPRARVLGSGVSV